MPQSKFTKISSIIKRNNLKYFVAAYTYDIFTIIRT